MKPVRKATKGTVLGALAGTAFFLLSESNIPKDANCSYLASPWTDVLVAGLGAVAIDRAYKTDESLYGFIGSSIVAIHALQFINHKGIKSFRAAPCSTDEAT